MRKLISLLLVILMFASVLSVSAFAQAPGFTGSKTTTYTDAYRCTCCVHVFRTTTTVTENYRSGTFLGSNISTTGFCPWCGIYTTLAEAGFGEIHTMNSCTALWKEEYGIIGITEWWP